VIVAEQSDAKRREEMITCESGGKYLDWFLTLELPAQIEGVCLTTDVITCHFSVAADICGHESGMIGHAHGAGSLRPASIEEGRESWV